MSKSKADAGANGIPNHAKGVVDSAGEKKPMREELEHLFQQYPNLRAKLKNIYEQTLHPDSRPNTTGRSRFNARWTEEKGFEEGLRNLKVKLESDSADQDDLKAFVAFVTNNSPSG
ncbi:uncharacterized protein HMPREF1541_08052 [Cyphellophora europaea CBS 101466]|uniref:Uncharacterized protein n=1 Tax=Cyphellophora europaea (strain CBS 101466) TaxID=1220924 RepID=W2RKP4_CYPE1|nr:uncharacterized protein HMPREF1541_08052 [Cyphellophora europaea CBS 101466]ETN37062.1 hypothetical protein HMPREF1541_08052 [Cyphellophora europaea CBS 101466]